MRHLYALSALAVVGWLAAPAGADCTGCSVGAPMSRRLAIEGETSGAIKFSQTCIDQFRGLPALAARLGVEPGLPAQADSPVLVMCDGRVYGLSALLRALIAQDGDPTPR